jgi:phosphomannomutase
MESRLLQGRKMKNDIKLRSTSDGWRGIIADTFTFSFVERFAMAIGNYILKRGGKETFVGYDTRFLSYKFAKRAGQVLNQLGVNALISSKPIPTPVVSFQTNQKGMVCGIIITASHNPYYYNGVKVRMSYGGPPDKEFAFEIQDTLASSEDVALCERYDLNHDDPCGDYCQKLRTLLDIKVFNSRSLKILVDTMHGTTSGVLKSVLSGTRTKLMEINSNFDPYFGGIAPEPMKSNTSELQKLVLSGQYGLGIAHDGDGDRIIAVISERGYLSPHDVALVLLWYLVEIKQQTGIVIGSVTMTNRLLRIAEYFGLPYKEVPIGFRNACEIMRKEKVLIASEENGGIGFGFYLPERDATLAAALLAEAEINYKYGIKGILNRVERVAGNSGFSRLNLRLSVSPMLVMEILKNEIPEKIANQIVKKVSEIDGIKLFLESDNWVNIRAAGTEELVRVYAESSNNEEALKVAKAAERIIRKIEQRWGDDKLEPSNS